MSAAPWPKRRDTTFTSSGCETSLGIRGCSFCHGLGSIFGHEIWHLLGNHIVVEVVVHLDGGGPAACADALNLFEREDAVGSDALMANAEFFLKALVNVVGTAKHATYIGADLHVEFAGGLETQHGVVGRDVANVEFGDADAHCDLGDDRVGEVADLVLRI